MTLIEERYDPLRRSRSRLGPETAAAAADCTASGLTDSWTPVARLADPDLPAGVTLNGSLDLI